MIAGDGVTGSLPHADITINTNAEDGTQILLSGLCDLCGDRLARIERITLLKADAHLTSQAPVVRRSRIGFGRSEERGRLHGDRQQPLPVRNDDRQR
jgi:hypothetical protein